MACHESSSNLPLSHLVCVCVWGGGNAKTKVAQNVLKHISFQNFWNESNEILKFEILSKCPQPTNQPNGQHGNQLGHLALEMAPLKSAQVANFANIKFTAKKIRYIAQRS